MQRVVQLGIEVQASVLAFLLHVQALHYVAITCGIHVHVVSDAMAEACSKAVRYEQQQVRVQCMG